MMKRNTILLDFENTVRALCKKPLLNIENNATQSKDKTKHKVVLYLRRKQ